MQVCYKAVYSRAQFSKHHDVYQCEKLKKIISVFLDYVYSIMVLYVESVEIENLLLKAILK
jgi:hypothetical protein